MTRVTRSRTSSASSSASRWRRCSTKRYEPGPLLGSLSESPMPIRSGAMQRPRGCKCGNTLRQRYDEVGLPCSSTMGSHSPTSTYAISRPWTRRRCFWYGNAAEIMLASPSFFVVAEEHRRPRACPPPACGQRGFPEGYTGRHAASSYPRVGLQSAAVLGCLHTCDLDGRLPPREEIVP